MARKNGRVIGNVPQAGPNQRSGVWDVMDISAAGGTSSRPMSNNQRPKLLPVWPSDSDPFYDNVVVHFPPPDEGDWILKDHSSNNWNDFLTQDQYYRAPIPSNNGPRYSDWHTRFHEDGYITVSDTTGLQFGTGAFTIEFWVYLQRQDATQHYVMGRGGQAGVSSGTGWVVGIDSSYQLFFYDAVGNTTTNTSYALTRDTWHHIAIVRSSTASNGFKIYVNGTARVTGTCSSNFADSSNLYIGRDRQASGTTWYGGRMTDIRILGSAAYSTNFTAPTSALSMTGALYSSSSTRYNLDTVPGAQPQGKSVTTSGTVSRFIGSPYLNDTSHLTSHGSTSAMVFNGNGWQRLYDTKPSNTTMRFGTGPFTIEAWIQLTNQGGGSRGAVIGKGAGNVGSASTGWNFWLNNTSLGFSDGATTITSNTVGTLYNGWHHVAAVREGTGSNQFKMYIDGALVYTGTVSTDFSTTDPTRIFSTRTSDYTLWGYCSLLKVSKVARYTSAFTSDQTIMDTVGTVDSNTSLLMCTSALNTARSSTYAWVNDGVARHQAPYRRGNEVRFGQHHPTSRSGAASMWCYGNSADKYIATTSQGDWNFGTGDFSIEFWVKFKWRWQEQNNFRVLLDTRAYFNDSGIEIRSYAGSSGTIQVITNFKPVLSDNKAIPHENAWVHVCVQRTSGALALYINGRKSHEVLANYNINSTNGKMYLFNGAYPNIHYGSSAGGAWMCDLRVVKGSGAYSSGSVNPDTISVPTSPLTAIANTVLLTFNKPICQDYSGRNNTVDWARADYATGGNWDIYMSNETPYDKGIAYDKSKYITGDSWNNDGGCEGRSPFYDTSIEQDFSFITRMSGPWTIEMFVYWHNSNPSAPTAYEYLFTGNATGHEGFSIRCGYGAGSASYNNVSFGFYTAHNSTVQWFNSSGTNPATLRSHSWNHIAIVYDPTRTSQVAMFVNGSRVATRAAFNAGTKLWNTYRIYQTSAGTGGLRISKTARYNNDATTYTIPTERYPVDPYNIYSTNTDCVWADSRRVFGTLSYGVGTASGVKNFGRDTMLFNTRETSLTERIYFGYEYWGVRSLDTETSDYTMEMWASYWDSASGGLAIPAEGRILFHFTNAVQIRINSSGYWVFAHRDGTTDRQTAVTTTTLAATRSSGTMDHIVMMRKGGNGVYYVNGVEVGQLFFASPGIVSSNGLTGTDYFSHNYYNIRDTKLGCDNSDTNATAWCGFVQDFRITRAARYDTKVINGVATMVHADTTIPALPTAPFPTK